MSFLTAHGDALGVAVALLVLAYLNRRAYKRLLARVRAQRDLARAEYWDMRDQRNDARADMRLLRALEPAVDFAESCSASVDVPIPYGVGPDPYAPVWTSGALLDDGASAHREFGDVIRTRFGQEAS